jgi:hypothetical protein
MSSLFLRSFLEDIVRTIVVVVVVVVASALRVMYDPRLIAPQDYIVKREEWAELKQQMPFGQVPCLQVSTHLTLVVHL